MPNNREEIELAFNIEMETRKSLGEISKIDKALKGMVNNRLKIKSFDYKSIAKFRREANKTKKDLRDISLSMSPKKRADLDKEFKAVERSFKKLSTVTSTERMKIRKFERKLTTAKTKQDRDAAKTELDLAKKQSSRLIHQARTDNAKKRRVLGGRMVATGATKDLKERSASEKRKQEFISDIKSTKVGAEMADGFKDALSSMKGKDIFGLGKAGYRLSAGMLKGAAKFSMAHGAGVAAKGAARGGMMGGAMQGIGKAMQGVTPLLGILSKLVPIMSLLGGGLMGLIKLFLDADSAVKEMNKTVLEGASTWDIYASQGKNVGMGMMHLDDILGKVRDQTTDFEMNMKMGTTAKDHQQFINTLTREGISLQHIDSTLEENKKDLDATNVSMKRYTDISSMAIGYSRLFGVSLDEIAQFQSEMMRDLGASLSDVATEFDKIGNAADAAGIAQNKFFAILRGVSSDMGLYGVRIEEVTKMLGQLGKVMSPRSAEKYMKTFAQGMKGTSVQDRVKTMLLGGPKAIKEVQQDIARQTDDMVKKFQDTAGIKDAGTAKAILSGKTVGGINLKGLEKTGKLGGAKSNDLQEQFQDLSLSLEQSKHGTYGAAMAAENMTGYGAMKAKRVGMGGKSFLSALKSGDIGEHQRGVLKAGGEENLKAYAHIEMAINQQKEAMVDAIDQPDSNPELIKFLKKTHKYDEKALKETNKKLAAGLSEDELWASLDEKNAAAEKTDAQKMLDAAKEQGTRTQGIVERLDAIFDALFNWIYKALTGLWDTLVDFWDSIPGIKGGHKAARELQRTVMDSKNTDVRTAFEKSGGDASKFRGNLMGTAGATAYKGRDAMVTEMSDLEKVIKDSTDDKEKKELTDQLKKVTAVWNKDWDAINAITTKSTQMEILKGMGGKFADISKYMKDQQDQYGIDYTAQGAATQLGITLSDKDISDLSNAMMYQADPAELAKLLPQLGSYQRGGGSGVVSGVPAQQQATAAAANPGSGGGAVAVSAPTPPPPPTAPGAGPAGTPGPASTAGPNRMPTVPDEQKMNAAVLDQVDFTGASVVNSLQDLWNALRMKGIKFDRTQLEGLYQDVIHKGTYLGAQDALAEYALYTATDPGGVLKRMKDSGFQGVGKLATTLEGQMDDAKKSREAPHAAGGLVTGISGGMAQISPAAGEGLTSIGRGERILPAGAGGGASISLTVNGIGGQDLANFLKEKINQGIHEYKRKEKFT